MRICSITVLGVLACLSTAGALMVSNTAQAQVQPRWAQNFTFDDAMDAFNRGDNRLAVRYLWPLANAGDKEAQYYLAYLLDTGQGTTKDLFTALKFYRRSAKQDYLPSIVYMGYAYSAGHGVRSNNEEAFSWYTRAAQMGDPIAQNNLATMLRTGRPYRANADLAIKWYLQAARQGNVRGQYNAAAMYHRGEGVEQDYKAALKWYGYAANAGDMYAQAALGYMYSVGDGVDINDRMSIEWYRRAAEQGHRPSQYNLALLYEKGKGKKGTGLPEAATWYFHAAKQGLDKAQYRLARMYENGTGLPQDDAEALKWYRSAAEEHEYLPAVVSLGRFLEEGRGQDKHERDAFFWYGRAAERDDAPAMLELARMHQLVAARSKLRAKKLIESGQAEEERLVSPAKGDAINAYLWYALAVSRLDNPEDKSLAVKERVKLANFLSTYELSRARRLVTRWFPNEQEEFRTRKRPLLVREVRVSPRARRRSRGTALRYD